MGRHLYVVLGISILAEVSLQKKLSPAQKEGMKNGHVEGASAGSLQANILHHQETTTHLDTVQKGYLTSLSWVSSVKNIRLLSLQGWPACVGSFRPSKFRRQYYRFTYPELIPPLRAAPIIRIARLLLLSVSSAINMRPPILQIAPAPCPVCPPCGPEQTDS